MILARFVTFLRFLKLARQVHDIGALIIHNYRANIIKFARQTTSARQRVSAA